MTIKRIDTKNVSILIQGPFSLNFKEHIKLLRSNFPDCEIIISTSEKDRLHYTKFHSQNFKLIISDDLECLYCDPITGTEDNLNKQVMTVLAGLRSSSRRYTLKIRSDFILRSDNLFFVDTIDQPSILKSKITTTSYGFINPLKTPFIGYFSDMVMFGETEDLLKYWSASENNFDYDYKTKDLIFSKIAFSNSGFRMCKYGCEQQLAFNYAKKIDPSIDLDSLDYFSLRSCYQFEKIAYSTFSLIDWNNSGIEFNHRFISSRYIKDFYSRKDFELLKQVTHSYKEYMPRAIKICIRKYIITFFKVIYYKGILGVIYILIGRILTRK